MMLETKLENIKQKIESSTSNFRVKVRRSFSSEAGDFEVAFEADIDQSLSSHEREFAVVMLALDAERAVIRHAYASGVVSKVLAADLDNNARQGFARAMSNLLLHIIGDEK